jgi:hypothetical protein
MLHGPNVFPFARCRHRPVVPRRGEDYLAEHHRMEEAACRGNEAQFPPTGVRERLLTHPTLGGRVLRYISTLAKWYDSAPAAMVLQGVMAALTSRCAWSEPARHIAPCVDVEPGGWCCRAVGPA